VQAHDLILLSDEIYERICYGGVPHCSPATFPGMAKRTLTVNGFSKAFSMTGWRVGYIVGHATLLEPILKVHQYGITCATSFAQYGAVAAYRLAQQAAQDMVRTFQQRKEALLRGLRAMEGVTCVEPQGSFYAFPNFHVFGVSSQQLAAYLLQEANVALVPGSAFGQQGEGHLRIAFCNSFERIEEAMQRIEDALIPLAEGT
jgi:aminotransferase